MWYVQGDILTDDGFLNGYLKITEKGNPEISRGRPPEKPRYQGIIIPHFFNAHTHLGDSFLKSQRQNFPRDVIKLVAPPRGVKHQLLKKATDKQIQAGIHQSIHLMRSIGTYGFCDFREGGMKGVQQIKAILQKHPLQGIVLSRPQHLTYDKKEVDTLLTHTDGIAISSISDWEYDTLQKIARHVHQNHKLFALHGSECVREDIDQILDLHPQFLIHMIQANMADLQRVQNEHIPIVLCPRSNHFFNLPIKYNRFKQAQVTLMLGTDNAMLHDPNILEEIQFLRTQTNLFSLTELLHMITTTPRKVLNLKDCFLAPNSRNNFVVLERKTLQPLYISPNHEG